MVWLQGVVKLKVCSDHRKLDKSGTISSLRAPEYAEATLVSQTLRPMAGPGTSSMVLGSPVSMLPFSHFLRDPDRERILSSTGLYRPSESSAVAFHSYLPSSNSRLLGKNNDIANLPIC